jgi:ribose transport system substrate-binding protein
MEQASITRCKGSVKFMRGNMTEMSRLKRLKVAAASGAMFIATLGVSLGAATTSGATSQTTATGLAYARVQVAKYSGKVTSSPVAKLTKVANLRGKTVWYVPITNAVDSLAGMGSTMSAALSHVGASVHVCDGGGLPTAVASCLTSAAQQGAAAVVTSYVDYNMAPTAFQALVAAKIPVIVGSESPPPGVAASKYLQFTYGTAQTDLFNQMIAFDTIVQSNGHANVLVIRLTDSPSTTAASNLEVSAFKTYCPACQVTVIDAQTPALGQLPSAVAAALTAHPDINYVTVPTDAYLPPVQGAIGTANLTSKIRLVSADGGVAGMQDVRSGALTADIGGPVEWIGWEYANAVVRIMSGARVYPSGIGPTLIFTSKNIGGKVLDHAHYLTLSWYGMSQQAFELPYLKAWGAK